MVILQLLLQEVEEGLRSAGQVHAKPPGVPVKISFADIRKATNNFHDTMKLGSGALAPSTDASSSP